MKQKPLIVLADDLTGAAEVAAIAFQAGLSAEVFTRLPRGPVETDVLVFNTDTRLATPAVATRRLRTAIVRLKKIPHAGWFKKTDSVLRGPVAAELAAGAQALGLRRTLLVPGNPSLGRVIRDGHYFISGQPLHETTFARDPHHPCTSSEVLTLLAAPKSARAVCLAPTARLPREGLIVGEAASTADIARWAQAVDRHTLPAGGADFFRAWLKTHAKTASAERWNPASGRVGSMLAKRNPSGGRVPPLDNPTLLLHGTTASPVNQSSAFFFRGTRAPAADKVSAQLRRHGHAIVTTSPIRSADRRAPATVSQSFANLAATLHQAGAFRHLLIVGGATAATVLHPLGWTRLKVVRVWGPGVVTLEPENAPGFALTLKPGSYPWPAKLRRTLPRLLTY